jgi:hypothetical protein
MKNLARKIGVGVMLAGFSFSIVGCNGRSYLGPLDHSLTYEENKISTEREIEHSKRVENREDNFYFFTPGAYKF